MGWNPSSPVVGPTDCGLTNPTWTFSADTCPFPNGKQYAVTALGGTQTGVAVSSVVSPFTFTTFKPTAFKVAGVVDAATGIGKFGGKNVHKFITRKGLLWNQYNPPGLGLFRSELEIPAGAESADANSLRALICSHAAMLMDQADAIVAQAIQGTL